MKRIKKKVKNSLAYIQGNLRYKVYYTPFNWLIPYYIREQIVYRINSMEEDCFRMGSCVLCGCTTTALQMANKKCDKPCYPEMLDKKTWKAWKEGRIIIINWLINTKAEKFYEDV